MTANGSDRLFMSFAKNELGFDVPYSGLIHHNGVFHYIIKRFDRYEEFRYEQYDFGQFLNMPSANKYNASSEEVFAKADAILQVVRIFEDNDIIHVHGKVDPKSDIEVINAELIMADIETVNKRIATDGRKARNDKDIAFAVEVYNKVLEKLNM